MDETGGEQGVAEAHVAGKTQAQKAMIQLTNDKAEHYY